MAETAPLSSDLGGYVERVARLLRLDAALLALETKQNLLALAISLGLFAAAAVAAVFGVMILLIAAVLLLVQLGLAPSLAALIVAIVLFAVAGGLVFAGIARLRSWSLKPRRTMVQFKSNLDALRASLRL